MTRMTIPMPYVPATVYLLADNLDAALAAGEDLLKSSLVWNSGGDASGAEITRERGTQRRAVDHIRTLEQVLLARVLKSRERAEEIGKRDERFGPIARLYNGGTAVLVEAVAELGDPTNCDFDNGSAVTGYLRARGLIGKEQPAPSEGETLLLTEEFLVARRFRLGTLMDLIAMFLDTLEVHYDLYSAEDAPSDLLPGEEPLAEGQPLS